MNIKEIKGRSVRAFGAHGTACKYLNIHFCELFLGALESSCSHDVAELRILILRRLRAEQLTKTSDKSDKKCRFFRCFFAQTHPGQPKNAILGFQSVIRYVEILRLTKYVDF